MTSNSSGRLVGYARVSTSGQIADSQIDALKAAGCRTIYQDVASGARANRPELKRCLEALREGDVLCVMRLDRLARSVQHLHTVVSELKERSVSFRSLNEGFDTGTPQGRFMMTMLGAIAELERDIIIERTRAGLASARRRGAVMGNPRFRARDQSLILTMKATQADTYTARAREASRSWRSMVTDLRPALAWDEVHSRIRARHPVEGPRTVERLVRIVRRLVSAGDLDPSVLARTTPPKAAAAAQMAIAIRRENPNASLRAMARILEESGVHPPRAERWSASTVKALLEGHKRSDEGILP